MAESYTRDTQLAFSTVPEATFNTASTTDSDYTAITLDPVPLTIPQPEQTPIIGGTEFPTGYCNGYWQPFQASISPLFTFTGLAGRFGLQAHGSSVAAAQQGGTAAYKHTATLGTSAEMLGRSFAMDNGDLSFLWAGNAVSRYRLEQVGGALPTCTVDLVGTGKFTETVPFTIPAVSNACSPIVTAAIFITDGYDTARNLYDAKVYAWNMELNNGADATSDLVRSAADSSQGPTGGTAKYVSRILRTFPRTVTLNVTVPVEEIEGESKGYWEQMAKGASITDVTLRLRGDQISGSYYYECNWKIADARYTATPVRDNNTIIAYDLTFSPVHNSTPITFAWTNITTSNYK